ncbi:hypothetical protein B0H63DRAFT_247125 [Podospora didyma]|uniref:Uncharacterized protein n=1 Tax=Podospora didyma TaxID=330526 RepID=A0AAE0KKQ6_9PEZI|nr:hypothetical protein B0H63DRAFT_247125 [Podospora didyma]
MDTPSSDNLSHDWTKGAREIMEKSSDATTKKDGGRKTKESVEEIIEPDNVQRVEQPKRVSTHSKKRALLQLLIFQFPAIAVTLGLLYPYINHVSWLPTANQLSALQFAAKVHESFIISSLFDIVSYHIRRALLGPQGVPFGYLTSAFQLSSPFYVISPSFLAPLIQDRLSLTLSSLGLRVLLVLAFLLAAISGASSGTIMLPRQGWHEIPATSLLMDQVRVSKFHGLLVSPASGLYPPRIDMVGVPDCCSSVNCSSFDYCPYLDFNNARSTGFSSLSMNILVSESPATVAGVDYISHTLDTNSTTNKNYKHLHIATSIRYDLFNLVQSAARDWSRNTNYHPAKLRTKIFDQNINEIPVKQPRVILQCSDNATDISSENSYTWHIRPGFYPELNLTVSKSVIGKSPASLVFIDINEYLPRDIKASAAIFIQETIDEGLAVGSPYKSNVICLVDARWVNSDLWINPEDIAPTPQCIPSSRDIITQYQDSSGDFVVLDLEWLNFLNTTLVTNSSLEEQDWVMGQNNAQECRKIRLEPAQYAFDLLIKLSVTASNNDFFKISSKAAGALAVFLTRTMSVIPRNSLYSMTGDSSHGPWRVENRRLAGQWHFDDGSFSSYARAEIWYYHDVYAYSFKETTTCVAWAVLLLHVLLVYIHLVTVMVNGLWNSGVWSQLGEMASLLTNSTPTPLLKNTGTGVGKWSTWRMTAYVREVEPGSGRIELVLEDKNTGMMTEPDKKYG